MKKLFEHYRSFVSEDQQKTPTWLSATSRDSWDVHHELFLRQYQGRHFIVYSMAWQRQHSRLTGKEAVLTYDQRTENYALNRLSNL